VEPRRWSQYWNGAVVVRTSSNRGIAKGYMLLGFDEGSAIVAGQVAYVVALRDSSLLLGSCGTGRVIFQNAQRI
jgi:hypothetical protein